MEKIKGYDALVADIVEKMEEAGIDEGTIDDTIHGLAGNEASDINNEGVESQVRAILGSCGIKDSIAEIKEIFTSEGSQYSPDENLLTEEEAFFEGVLTEFNGEQKYTHNYILKASSLEEAESKLDTRAKAFYGGKVVRNEDSYEFFSGGISIAPSIVRPVSKLDWMERKFESQSL